MTPPSVSVAVMAHRKREQFVPELLEALDRPAEVVWDRRDDRWDTGRRAMLAHDRSATHHLVVQDDAIVCRDLVAGVEQALAHVPTGTPLCLYVGRLTPFPAQVTQIADQANRDGVSWLTMASLHWGVGIVMPTRLIDPMVTWGDRRGRHIANYDKRISRWLGSQGITTWYPWPSLVDHRDSPSLVRGRGSRGRYAHLFAGRDTSALDLDWSGGAVHVQSLRSYRGRPLARHRSRHPRRTKEMEPMPHTTSGEVMIATKNALVTIDGQRRKIRRGETVAHVDSWIVRGRPRLWEPIRIHFPADVDERDDDNGPPPPDPPADPPAEPTPKEVRAWARANGIDVPARGALSAELVARYKAGHDPEGDS